VDAELTTSMYLGDHWEHLLRRGTLTLRSRSAAALERGRHWVELPRDDLWIFPAAA
jgi:iron(III) transport system ATP-binding protein